MTKHLLLAVACSAGMSSVAVAEEFTGKVVGVSDGDTITVVRDKTPVKVRLQGVDCPAEAQPFGAKARRFTSDMVLGKVVTVKVATKDRVAWVSVGGKSLNEELLRAGLAWWYRPQARKDKKLAALVAEAAKAKRGLWADHRPIPPWVWRNPRDKTDPILERRMQEEGWTEDGVFRVDYRGNARSQVFHAAGCNDYNCKQCTATFPSASAAVKAGYRAHTCIDRPKVSPASEAPSEERACKDDKDCTFAPPSPCACPPCGDTWQRAVNKKHAAFLRGLAAVGSCGRGNCQKCNKPVHWLGDKAVCSKGQCTVVVGSAATRR